MMPIPVAYLAGAAIGAAGGVAIEYVLSRGTASRDEYVVAGTIGALPGGLGAKGALSLTSKVSKLRYFSRASGDSMKTIAAGVVHPGSQIYLGREARAVATGVVVGTTVGYVYDKTRSTRVEHTSSSRGGTTSTRKSMRGGSAQRKLDKSSWAGRKTRSRASSKKPAGMISRANRGGAPSTGRPRRRTPKALPYRKGGCPPGYRYDPRRKMCVRTY